MENNLPPHRKVWARGFYDGLRAAGVVDGNRYSNMMSQARFNSIYSGLTSVAKKVYEVVPIAEAWETDRIMAEIRRTGQNISLSIAAGCLNNLIQAGLVTEPSRRMFRKSPIRPVPVDQPTPEATQPPAMTTPTPNPQGPIDKLTALSARVHRSIKDLQALATDIDTAALEIEEQISATDAETEKLKQLKNLLKALN